VHLCQLCHTAGVIDPDTGNSIEFQNMIHRLHRGADLPSVNDGPVGTKYSFIGFQGQETIFGEKVKACVGGPLVGLTCTVDADCRGGTCTGSTTIGVGFPQDLRNCVKCHSQGRTAANYLQLPSTTACASCHDDVNPSQAPTQAGPPGTNHGQNGVIGPQSETFCRLCHIPTGPEFDINVTGAHTIPEQSAQLTGLVGQILSASGTPGSPVTVAFKVTTGAGAPVDIRSGFNRVALALSGPTTDFGGSAKPLINPTIVGGGASGTLSPPVNGVFTYVTSAGNALPGNAAGTWRLGLEARRSVTVGQGALLGPQTATEALQNPVLDFSIDGTPVAPRRKVVDVALCGSCHGTFSKTFSVHGNLRNQSEYCVVCHNPNVSDFGQRKSVVGADPNDQPIVLKHLIHMLHTGSDLSHLPYFIYGFGASPADFSDIGYPGDRRDCAKCHLASTNLVPLPAGVRSTQLTQVSNGVEMPTGTIPPTQDACLSCHDGDDVRAHAQVNTTPSGQEACPVCHAEGAPVAVSTVHFIGP
jgi:OmcA/MtrC family decaheme c-type cytochrome